MNRHTETANRIERCDADAHKPEKSQCHMCKEEWIQHYADRMLRLWLAWQTRLGVARDYVEQLKANLAELYEEPLKKVFIEKTY